MTVSKTVNRGSNPRQGVAGVRHAGLLSFIHSDGCGNVAAFILLSRTEKRDKTAWSITLDTIIKSQLNETSTDQAYIMPY